MGALKMAFDVTIVGALALPWILLVIHLFFPEIETPLAKALSWMDKKLEGFSALWPVAAVVLFAIAYTLGSAVTRVAEDFFNDDDLYLSDTYLHSATHLHLLLRVGVSEDRILAKVYCENERLLAAENESVLAQEVRSFKTHCCMCKEIVSFATLLNREQQKEDNDLRESAASILGLQEDALMEKGGDYSARLRELHDQVMVLRGAAFNGLIAFSLCLFAWGAVQRDKGGSRLRPLLVRVPYLYLAVGLIAAFHHFKSGIPPDPPYMESTLLLLGFLGRWLLRRGAGQETGTKVFEKYWLRLAALFFVLMVAAGLGWWSTKVQYAEQVIYSYDSQIADTQGATRPPTAGTTP
jgi:hypothetical protein